MRCIVICLLLCNVFCFKAQAQPTFNKDNKLKTHTDSIVEKAATTFMNDPQRMGLSIGIVKDGKMYTYNYGTTEKGKTDLPTANTIYEIGSLTKTFTATLLAHAVVEGKINLSDDIRKYLTGDYPNLEYKGYPITVADLANHTSRLPHDIPGETKSNLKNPTLLDIIKESEHDKTFSVSEAGLHAVKIDTLPGYKIEYSNAGIQLLGKILEKVYGMDYEQLIKKYITGPLKMKNTRGMYSTLAAATYTKGYDNRGNEMPHLIFQMPGAAGGLISNLHDMLLYIKKNIEEKDSAIKLTHQKTTDQSKKDGIGLCWEITDKKSGVREFSHDGGMPGFTSVCFFYPQQKMGVIALTNQSGVQSQVYNLLRTIVKEMGIQ